MCYRNFLVDVNEMLVSWMCRFTDWYWYTHYRLRTLLNCFLSHNIDSIFASDLCPFKVFVVLSSRGHWFLYLLLYLCDNIYSWGKELSYDGLQAAFAEKALQVLATVTLLVMLLFFFIFPSWVSISFCESNRNLESVNFF
jgi:hypothetical protein